MLVLLASSSPRRRDLLTQAGIAFVCIEPGPEPTDPGGLAADALARRNAHVKAQGASVVGKDGLLLAADTVVAMGDVVLGKPQDRADALTMLAALEGRSHEVWTAHSHAIVRNGRLGPLTDELAVATVRMDRRSDAERRAYLDTLDWQDKAGAYGIQSLTTDFVHLESGRLDTVIGLTVPIVEAAVEAALLSDGAD